MLAGLVGHLYQSCSQLTSSSKHYDTINWTRSRAVWVWLRAVYIICLVVVS